MPNANYPLGMRYLNSRFKYIPWKNNTVNGNVSNLKAPPPKNSAEPLSGHGKANPIRHYRRQYGSKSNKVSVNQINYPGGFANTNESNNCQEETKTLLLVNENGICQEVNVTTKVNNGKINTHLLKNDTNDCNVACNARDRVVNGRRPKTSNMSSSEYLKYRCKTYQQNIYHYETGNPADKNNNLYNSNCGSKWDETANGGAGGWVDCQRKTVYKNSNNKFTKNSAGTSSNRLLGLKYNTIMRTAKSTNDQLGHNVSGLTYSERTDAPFNIKLKNNNNCIPRHTVNNLTRCN